jgi:hypothetical protein
MRIRWAQLSDRYRGMCRIYWSTPSTYRVPVYGHWFCRPMPCFLARPATNCAATQCGHFFASPLTRATRLPSKAKPYPCHRKPRPRCWPYSSRYDAAWAGASIAVRPERRDDSGLSALRSRYRHGTAGHTDGRTVRSHDRRGRDRQHPGPCARTPIGHDGRDREGGTRQPSGLFQRNLGSGPRQKLVGKGVSLAHWRCYTSSSPAAGK